MIIFLNKKDKEFTYFMLITGMKQRVVLKKKKKCSYVGPWLVDRTEFSI